MPVSGYNSEVAVPVAVPVYNLDVFVSGLGSMEVGIMDSSQNPSPTTASCESKKFCHTTRVTNDDTYVVLTPDPGWEFDKFVLNPPIPKAETPTDMKWIATGTNYWESAPDAAGGWLHNQKNDLTITGYFKELSSETSDSLETPETSDSLETPGFSDSSEKLESSGGNGLIHGFLQIRSTVVRL